MFGIGIEESSEEGYSSKCFSNFYALEGHFVLFVFGKYFEDLFYLSFDFQMMIFHSIFIIIDNYVMDKA